MGLLSDAKVAKDLVRHAKPEERSQGVSVKLKGQGNVINIFTGERRFQVKETRPLPPAELPPVDFGL